MIKAIVIRLLILAATIFICCEVNSQIRKETAYKDTTIKGKVEVVYVGSKGGKYILVTSKSGNVYKKYLTTKKQ
jgi:hypothetical protein